MIYNIFTQPANYEHGNAGNGVFHKQPEEVETINPKNTKDFFGRHKIRAFIAVMVLFYLISTAFAQDSNLVRTKSGWLKIEHLASLSEPWGMTWLPGDRLLITEKPGHLRIYAAGKLSEPISGLPKIEYRKQGGLLDVEVDPDFAKNNFIYLYFTEAAEKQPNVTRDEGDPRFGQSQDHEDVTLKGGAVARGRLAGNQLQDVKIIWRQVPKTIGRGHFGGRLVFAPDGKLFITSGERQRFDPAQDPAANLGKIVRINSDGSIPADNPFVNKAGTRFDIWSMGHRNPLGAAINPASKQLWIHEMGPAHGDELNIPAAGKNYGWPLVSNGNNYDGSDIPDHPTKPNFAAPVYYWYPAISPSGLIFYSGNLFKDWSGNAILGGLSSEALICLKLNGDKVESEERVALHRRVRDMIQAADGSIWLLTDYKDGELLRLAPVPR